MTLNDSNVAIIIIHHKPTLEWFEEIALQQCKEVFCKRDRFLVCPKNLPTQKHREIDKDLITASVLESCLSNYHNFNLFKCTPNLYQYFSHYDWVLFYELDCFAFEDKLDFFCKQSFDYIGAPWFAGYDKADPSAAPVGVGNGGFSLRRVSACLKTLHTLLPPKFIISLRKKFGNLISTRPIPPLRQYDRSIVESKLGLATGQEDIFWSQIAVTINPEFRVADYQMAKEFSFEVNPARLYRELGHLPFGCHKWHLYDRSFWEHFIHFPSEAH